MKIKSKNITKIVKTFFAEKNPEKWDGHGIKPRSFDNTPFQCTLTDTTDLRIEFVYTLADTWCYQCSICDHESLTDDKFIVRREDSGINSIMNVSDTIIALCHDIFDFRSDYEFMGEIDDDNHILYYLSHETKSEIEPLDEDICKWIKYDDRTICPTEHDENTPYLSISENMDKLKYCPYCGKEIVVENN